MRRGCRTSAVTACALLVIALSAAVAVGVDTTQPMQINKLSIDEAAVTKAHSTERYRTAKGESQTAILMLRRTRTVDATVELNGKLPSGWKVELCLKDDAAKYCDMSTFKASSADGKTVTVQMTIKGSFAVGLYTIFVQVTDGSRQVRELDYAPNRNRQKVGVIFDSYNPKEPVYTANKDFIDEFLHNERGAFWVGETYNTFFRPWSYDHYNIEVVEIVLTLASRHIPVTERRDVVLFSRALAGLPRNKKETVLVGKWDPPYTGGVFPPDWLSSYDIFKVFRDTKTAAKFGQCMIFAAFTTTWFRAVGIPARPITIYDFATATSDKYEVTMKWDLSPDGKYYTPSKDNSDKLWGFHAVTEVLMKRAAADTEATWQVVDGTWQAGPMSVAKFKANAEAEQYDTKTYLKAMNSKVIYFNQNPVTKKHDIKIERPIELASKIITKGWDRNCNVQKDTNNQYTQLCFQDLVSSYKTLPARFRALHKKLLRRGAGDESGPGFKSQTVNGWSFTTFIPVSKRIGEPVKVKLSVRKLSSSTATKLKSMSITASVISYTGVPLSEEPLEVAFANIDQSSQSQMLELTISSEKHLRALLDAMKHTQIIRFNFQAFWNDGTLAIFEQRPYAVELPKLTMLGADTVKKGNKISVNVQFSNPFPFELGAATLQVRISGDAVDEIFTQKIPRVAAKVPGANLTSYRVMFDNVQIKAMVAGPHWVMGSLIFEKDAEHMAVFGLNDITVTP